MPARPFTPTQALPAPLPPTLYARFGDNIFFALLLVFAAAGVITARKKPA